MQVKPKICKGTNKAIGHGCGELKYIHRFGLCSKCFGTWLYSTDSGNELLEKSKIKGKKIVDQKEKKEWKERKEKTKTLSDWKNDLQKEINLIVRLIDKGHHCISSQRDLGKSFDAGHLFSRGSNPHIRYHLFNIWAQSVADNQYKSGNPIGFINGIEQTFGTEIKEYCISLKGLPELKISIDEIKQFIQSARQIVKELKSNDKVYSTIERIELRHKYQKELGIYK